MGTILFHLLATGEQNSESMLKSEARGKILQVKFHLKHEVRTYLNDGLLALSLSQSTKSIL